MISIKLYDEIPTAWGLTIWSQAVTSHPIIFPFHLDPKSLQDGKRTSPRETCSGNATNYIVKFLEMTKKKRALPETEYTHE